MYVWPQPLYIYNGGSKDKGHIKKKKLQGMCSMSKIRFG